MIGASEPDPDGVPKRFNGMSRHPLTVLSVLALAACGQAQTNAPTDPAAPIDTPEAQAPPPTPPPGVGSIMPGSGPATFVGLWVADAAWCANPRGPKGPIRITPLRFEGYENSCGIVTVSQVANGYEAILACAAEGRTTNERVRMSVQGDGMKLIWLNRDRIVVPLARCPAPAAVAPPPVN